MDTPDKKKTMTAGRATIKPMSGGRVLVRIGKETTIMPYKDLWGVVFMLGDGEYRDSMMPVRKTEMMVFSRKHTIRAEKDIKVGETLNVWCEVNIPKTIVESITEQNGAKVIVQTSENTVQAVPIESLQ